jgi:hypothetical protein
MTDVFEAYTTAHDIHTRHPELLVGEPDLLLTMARQQSLIAEAYLDLGNSAGAISSLQMVTILTVAAQLQIERQADAADWKPT